MPRTPDEGEPRELRIFVRVLPEERDAWKRAAKREGLTLSAWVRKLANRAAKKGKG